ncbi:MAG: lipoyl(octanoyl) transferase [Candidatus Azotimanducaceae bacterium]|jgi:lipoyl(octanoyl) transferase
MVRNLAVKNFLNESVEYESTWQKMREFTLRRTSEVDDELWLVQHPPVFTLGQAGKEEHILVSTETPIVRSDRGGQVTYHGPGQLVVYTLFDIRRMDCGVRQFVTLIEQSLIALLAEYDVIALANPQAPGVYVEGRKIAALGLRVRKGCAYHGLSLNVNMDLGVFSQINPCGYEGLEITQTSDQGINADMAELAGRLTQHISVLFGYDDIYLC